MKRDIYKIIEISKKKADDNYTPTTLEVKTLIDDNLSVCYTSIYPLLLNIFDEAFYFGYAQGTKATLNKIKKKKRIK